MSTGRGGGGNFRTVKEKKYVTETTKNASTAKKMLEVEPPRLKVSYELRCRQPLIVIDVGSL
jgi:hypothetical protein